MLKLAITKPPSDPDSDNSLVLVTNPPTTAFFFETPCTT